MDVFPTTPEQDAILHVLISDARSVASDDAGAAEMLMSAAMMVLIRSHGPRESVKALEQMIGGAREAIDEGKL